MIQVQKKLINLVLFTLFICTTYYVNMNIETIKVIAPAGCPSCLCMNVPTCGDVVIVDLGAPFVNKRFLGDSEYVEEPYLSSYGGEEYNRQFPLAYVGNTLLLSFVYFGIYKVKSSILRSRK